MNQLGCATSPKFNLLYLLLLLIYFTSNEANCTDSDKQDRYSYATLIQKSSKFNLGQTSAQGRNSILDDMDVEIVGSARKPLVNLATRGDERADMTTRLLGEILNKEDEEESAFSKPISYQQQQTKSVAQIQNEVSGLVHQDKPQEKLGNLTQDQNNLPKKDDNTIQKKITSSDYLVSMFITLGILSVIFILKAFTICCPCFNFSSDPTMKEAVYAMFREIIFVLVCILLVLQLYTQGILDPIKEIVFQACIIALSALFVWTLVGICLIISAQWQYASWKNLEKNSTNYEYLEKLKKYYEDLYYDHPENEVRYHMDPSKLEQIKYSVMRLEFINPIYLPPLKEAFLRKDFNFAKYLSYSYGKTLTTFFNTSWVSIIFLVIFLDLFSLTNVSKDQWTHTQINFIVPLVFLIVFGSMYLYITSIERQLYPQIIDKVEVTSPESLHFHQQFDGIDPFAIYDVIPQPEYLDIKNADQQRQTFENQEQDDEEDYLMRRSEVAFNRPQASESYLFGQPNRHEALFIGGVKGKGLLRGSLQIFYILSILYFSAYISYNAFEAYKLYETQDSRGIFATLLSVTIICPIVMIVLWVTLLPLVLKSMTIATNIEMMKDQKIIEKVVAEQKIERAKVSYRIFQVFKLIRRELIAEMKKPQDDRKLREITNNQIIEAFHVSGGKKQKFIQGEGFSNLARLCGNSLTAQESYIFLKKANSQGDVVNYNEFSKAVEQNLNDAKIDPYYLVLFLLTMFFNDKKKVTFEEFQQFFGEFDSYFIFEDIEAFLEEVKYIKREREMIDFRELASLIRDDIESFPK